MYCAVLGWIIKEQISCSIFRCLKLCYLNSKAFCLCSIDCIAIKMGTWGEENMPSGNFLYGQTRAIDVLFSSMNGTQLQAKCQTRSQAIPFQELFSYQVTDSTINPFKLLINADLISKSIFIFNSFRKCISNSKDFNFKLQYVLSLTPSIKH